MSGYLIAALIASGFFIFALVVLYSYGRFAKRVKGPDSHALPREGGRTALDALADGLETPDPADTGLLLVADNLDAFAVRALTARNAGRSLDLMYYYWRDDLTGGLLARELVEAADRGVRVRLLIDDINTRNTDPLYRALDRHANIAVRLFNPTRARGRGLGRGVELVLRLGSINRRMHNKAWIADGRFAIVGGRNVGDEYFDAGAGTNFRDLDVLTTGPAVADAERIFDAFWNADESIPIDALAKPGRRSLSVVRDELARRATGERAVPYLARARARFSVSGFLTDAGRIRWTRKARAISDPPDKASGVHGGLWLMGEILPALRSAERRLDVASPYFIPGPAGCALIEETVQRGVAVTILTNSLAATDVAAVHGAYARYRERVLRAGARLYELMPEAAGRRISVFGSRGASLHTKAFAVDDGLGFIGSFNFDPRSVSLNTEMGILFEHPDLVADMREIFALELSPEASFELGIEEDELVWHGTIDGAPRRYTHEPMASAARRAVATVVGWLPLESQL